jgi:chaperone BCS1
MLIYYLKKDSGMINALDGLTKKTGLLTFLTTNFIEKLDDALIRPGRIDLHIKFSYIVDEQKRMMCKRFIPFMNDDEINEFIESTKRIKMTTAILQQFLFHNDNEDINKRKNINELEKLAKKYIKKDNVGHMYN